MSLLEEVKSLITSILISNPNPSTVSKLDRDYFNQTGTKIPYQSLGYATLKEFLNSIPDVLAISVSGGKTRLSAIIDPKHKLISMQKEETERHSNKNNLHRFGDLYEVFPKNNDEWSDEESYLSYYTNISTGNSKKLQSVNDLEQCSNSKLNHAELSSKSLENGKVTTNGANQNSKVCCVPTAVQNNLRIIINSFKNGLIYTQLPAAYKFWFDKELDFREFNYNNLLEMCQDLQNIFLLTSREEIILFDQSEPLSKDAQKRLKLFKSSRKKKSSSNKTNPISNKNHAEPTSLSAHMNQLDVQKSSNIAPDLIQPVSLSKLPPDLSQSKCSHQSVRSSQSTVLTNHIPMSSCISSCSEPVPFKQLTYSQISDNEKIEYPANVIKLSEEISHEFITITDQIHQTFFVHVAEIYDPSKFWIILHKNYLRLNELHQKMQFWSKYRNNFKIPVNCLRCGLYCAALYNNEYYRGMVVKLSLSRHRAKVYFIDFGTVAVTNSNELLFLHKDFIKFPQQAIRARLAGIQPADANSPWCEGASNYFENQVSEKTMEANVFKINEESQIVELILQDKDMSNCINNNLVTAGYAMFDYEAQKERQFTNIVPIVNFIHLYPTFDEIEKGIVPTAEDTLKLKQVGHEYDYIYPKYFKKGDLNVSIKENETEQRSNNIQISQHHGKVEKQNQDEFLSSWKSLSDPAKCRLRLTKIISFDNQLHDKQLINNISTNLFKPTDSNNFLEFPTNITGYYSVDILDNFSLSQNVQINDCHLNTLNINCLNNLENFQVKQKLESFILQNLRSGNTTSLYYIKRLLHEVQLLTYSIQNVYNIVKDEYMSLPHHILQFFITMLLNYFDSGKLLELYTFVYHVSSPSTDNQSLIGIDGTNHNEIITKTDFSGCLIYLYRIHNQVYVDMREMLQLTNLNELPLHRITNEIDMENFIGSLLITTLIEHPKLIRELERYKIGFSDKLFLLKVQFIPKFYQTFANEVLPQSSFEEFLKKININFIP